MMIPSPCLREGLWQSGTARTALLPVVATLTESSPIKRRILRTGTVEVWFVVERTTVTLHDYSLCWRGTMDGSLRLNSIPSAFPLIVSHTWIEVLYDALCIESGIEIHGKVQKMYQTVRQGATHFL